jgi:hypothetical protein
MNSIVRNQFNVASAHTGIELQRSGNVFYTSASDKSLPIGNPSQSYDNAGTQLNNNNIYKP